MQVKFTRTILAGAAVALGLAFAAPTASAQMGFVVQGNYGEHSELGAGAGVTFGLGSLTQQHGIRAEATFNYYFDGFGGDFDSDFVDVDASFWEIVGSALMDIRSVPGLYAGAGVNYGNSSYESCVLNSCVDASNSEIGLHILAGWNFSGSKGPFVQGRFGISGYDQLVVTAGLRF